MEYSIRPQDHEIREARNTVQGALEACKPMLPKDEDVEVSLGWTSGDYTKEKLGGISGTTLSRSEIVIEINPEAESWKKNLERTVAHEYAHTVFFQTVPREDAVFNWQHILLEAQAQHFAEQIFPEGINNWKDAIGVDEIKELWDEIRDAMNDEWNQHYPELFFGNETFPEWTGYTVAYRIGQKLLEEHELEDFPELKRSDVLEAGDALFS